MNVTAKASGLEPLLLEVVDVMNNTLDLDTTLRLLAELIRKVVDYETFSLLALHNQRQELVVRFQVGYPKEVANKFRVKVGQGVAGRAAQSRKPVLVNDATQDTSCIDVAPGVQSVLAIPLVVGRQLIGVMEVAAREKNYFTEEHQRVLEQIAARIGIGLKRTSRQTRALLMLNEIARELTSILNLDELLQRIAELLSRLIDYQMFSILLLDPDGQILRHRFSQRFQERLHLKHEIPLGRGITGSVAARKEAILAPDVTKEPRYVALNPETRSELAAPLIYKDNVIGVLDLEHTRRGYFTEDHKRTLTTLAAQVAIAIENARLYEEIARRDQHIKRDMLLARELQFQLLPHAKPKLAHLEVGAKFVPARAIGGDLYDYIPYSLSRLGIVIGDVSGKGVPAAIYASLVSGILRSHAPIEPSPSEMLSKVNLSLAERHIDGQFVSLIYCLWDDQNRSLRVANSGLPRPIYYHDGKIDMVEATGLPLGLFDEADYDELTFRAKESDLFVFFSDGIVDAQNRGGDPFGRKRIEEIVATCTSDLPESVVNKIFEAVNEHASGTESFDDQTVVAIKVKGEPGRLK